MTSTTQSAYHARLRPAAGRVDRVLHFLSRLSLAYRIHRERRALLSLSEQGLKDIGLSRSDAYREAYRPWWDFPDGR